MIRLDHEIEAFMDATEPPPSAPIYHVDGWKMSIHSPWSEHGLQERQGQEDQQGRKD